MTATALSQTSGPTDTPLLTETIGVNLARTVERFGDREALVEVWSGKRWTYDELLRDVDTIARGLMARGIQRGDRVGIWSPNRSEWTLVQYATARMGAVLVNINPAYRSHELEYVVKQSGMRTIIAAVEYKTSQYRRMIEEVRGDCPDVTDVVYFDDPTWEALVADGEKTAQADLEARLAELDADDAINIQYTSGTTGFPKGATLTHRNILNNGYFVGEMIHMTEQDRLVIPVPFYHCFGMVMSNLASTSHGACMIIPAPTFDPAVTMQAVSDEKATILHGVPTMFIAELALPNLAEYDLSNLRSGIMAGSPCPVEVMKKVITVMNMTEVAINYGMTETSPVSTSTRIGDDIRLQTETVGRVMPHLEIKIVDPVTGETAPRNQAGEFCTKGYSVMKGYWNNEEKTREAIDEDGWMHTGDLATMDDDGYCAIVGRIKDMVIRGGENVYPREIEEFLYTHPDIADVQVIGVPDEKYGEELMAWIVMAEGKPALTSDQVREFCTGQLAHFKIPRYVHITDGFPMTVTGKIRKIEMREMAKDLIAGQ